MAPEELREKLINAFKILDHNGIAARPDFSCCSNCGVQEMQEMSEIYENGYVFWHMQDNLDLLDGLGCYLTYGGFGENETESIGTKIIDTLDYVGIKTMWSGKGEDRICVLP